jgi:hypothetical protein
LAAPLYLIGNLESRRTRFFVEAIKRTGLKWRIISWESVLSGSDDWARDIEPGSSIRIDSPGQNFAVEKALLARGINEPPSTSADFSEAQLRALPYEKGRILALNQSHRGWTRTLRDLEERLSGLQVQYFNPPGDIVKMFKKPLCNRLLREANVPVPSILGMPDGFYGMMKLMRVARCSRLFVKPDYGSSASGIVAFEFNGTCYQAFSPIEIVRDGGELKLFNSRRVKRYEGLAEVRELIDAIAREDVYLERWLPKAGLSGKRFDLRVVVIGGKARHVVVRLSDHPMTNLHLGATRGDLDLLQKTMGEEAWHSAMATAEKAMTAFPNSLYGGIDLLISPGWKKHAVLEINAFGDLLPHVYWQGMDTYVLQLKTWIEAHG